MAWTDIPDSVLEPGKPIRSVDGIALRDNPIAIANGNSGAPKIQTAALDSQVVTTAKIANSSVTAAKLADGSAESNWVGARTAALSVGGIGTYALMNSGGGPRNPGDTRAGSSLNYADAGGATNISASGTWRCMGFASDTPSTNTEEHRTTLWLRIS